MTSASPTIAALATAPTAGAVGILRLSGPAALDVGRLLAPGVPAEPTPRHAYLATFVDSQGRALDEGLFLYFRAPHSFTGEDVVELQAHGSPRLLRLLLARALEDERVRPASPGEFTRRAFLNGRLDLTRAEAVADLVAADSEAAVRAAAAGLSGALASRVRELEEPLRALHADLEGVLNFPDEAEGADAEASERVDALRAQAEALLAEAGRGRLVRRGARVALYGPVNAGKSTLFNRLVGEARALVDDEPGTTRDALEARVEWNGLGVTLFDTAGLRETPGRVEALGIARTRELLAGVDLAVLVLPPEATEAEAEAWTREAGGTAVLCVDGKCDVSGSSGREGVRSVPRSRGADSDSVAVGSASQESPGPGARPGRAESDLVAVGGASQESPGPGARPGRAESDLVAVGGASQESLGPGARPGRAESDLVAVGSASQEAPGPGALPRRAESGATPSVSSSPRSVDEPARSSRPRVSGLTGEGVEALRTTMLGSLWGGGTPSAVALVSERHADALRRASEALARAGAASRASTLEVVSGEVGLALEALGEVSGTSVSEALLDAIFQRFCIGK